MMPSQLKLNGLFSDLNEEEMTLISENIITRSFKKNTFIYKEGDFQKKLFYLVEGLVKQVTYGENGREFIHSIVRENEVFGEQGVFNGSKHLEFSIVLSKEATVHEIILEKVIEVGKLNHRFLFKLGVLTSNKYLSTLRGSKNLIFMDVKSRIKNLLVNFAKEMGVEKNNLFQVKHYLSHQDIANMIGTSRQTVTMVLNELKQEKLLCFERNFFEMDKKMIMQNANN